VTDRKNHRTIKRLKEEEREQKVFVRKKTLKTKIKSAVIYLVIFKNGCFAIFASLFQREPS
jgi:hypothetical protein